MPKRRRTSSKKRRKGSSSRKKQSTSIEIPVPQIIPSQPPGEYNYLNVTIIICFVGLIIYGLVLIGQYAFGSKGAKITDVKGSTADGEVLSEGLDTIVTTPGSNFSQMAMAIMGSPDW